MHRFSFFLPLALLFTGVDMAAQNTPRELLSRFFTIYEQQGAAAAVDYVFAGNPYLEANAEGKANIKEQLAGLLDVVGSYTGYEAVQEQSLGASLTLYRYLIKYERQPIQFIFIFYNPKGGWRFQNFMFNSNVDDILEAMSLKLLESGAGKN